MNKRFVTFFLVFISLSATASEQKSLSCSNNGTLIFYVNGVLNDLKTAKTNHRFLNDRISKITEKLDAKDDVTTELHYNTSESIWDITQLVRQKLAGQKRFNQIEIDELVSSFLFDVKSFIEKAGDALYKEIQSSWAEKYQDRISEMDIQLLAIKINTAITIDRKKVIVVSHSQGNIYANRAYEVLVNEYGLSEDLSKYYGNIQIASVTNRIVAKNSRYITNDDDLALNLLRSDTRPVMPANFATSCSVLNADPLCHEFEGTYLSNLPATGQKQGRGKVTRTFAQVFDESLEEVAWMLANNDSNCCNGNDGRFHRNDYDSPSDGFVESSVYVDPNLNLQVEASQVCGAFEFRSFEKGNKIVIDNIYLGQEATNPIVLTGNIYVKDYLKNESQRAQIISNQSSVPMVIGGGIIGDAVVEGPLYLLGSTIEGPSIVKGELFEHPSDIANNFAPLIVGSRITGQSETSGNFILVRRNIHNSRIYGGVPLFESRSLRSTFVGESFTYPFDNVTVGGNVYVSSRGIVEPGTTLRGFQIDSNTNGIIIDEDARVKSGSTITGTALIQRFTTYKGEWAGDIDAQGMSGYLRATLVTAKITGAPKISNYFIGPDSASGRVSTITGSPIENSYLYGCNVSCNAKVIDESASDSDFGCGYESSEASSIDFVTIMNLMISKSYNEIQEDIDLVQPYKTQDYADFLSY